MATEKSVRGTRKVFTIAGPDFDLPLVKTLQVGDRVMVELNGFRLFSSNPIAAENEWIVLANDDEAITIEHPRLEDKVILPYKSLVSNDPAVFLIQGDPFHLQDVYVVIQMIAHRADIEMMRKARYRWWINVQDYVDVFKDPILRRHTLEAWAKYFKQTFTETGWGNTSFRRFAIRANIKTDTIRAFCNEAWETLNKLTQEQFCNIGREFELLPTRMILSNEIQHDAETVFGEPPAIVVEPQKTQLGKTPTPTK